ncbi:MAG: hypothetical protein AAF806_17115 [Bacteroidota bacterium]
MIANLDNEVYFKKVFTDVEVFHEFVKDVLDIDLNIKKVETEKVLLNPVGAIRFRMDLFAEDEEKRTIVEIQKVDYDYSYNRFSHYFMANMLDVQRSSRDYSYEKDIYVIVVMTESYKINEKNGKSIRDDILVTDINPRTLKGEMRYMQDHKMVILNPRYANENTPQDIKDWMDLIMESMFNGENPKLNLQKKGIAKAAQLAEVDKLTPEQRAEAKIMEMRKIMLTMREDIARKEVQEEAEKLIQEERLKAEEERLKAEEERLKAEEERLKAEKERQAKYKLIKNLAKANMSTAEIAKLAEMNEAAVTEILQQED